MIDEAFVNMFNIDNQKRPYTMEEVVKMFDAMPSQRVGVLFDLIRWVKKDSSNASRVILIHDRMRQIPPHGLSSRYILE